MVGSAAIYGRYIILFIKDSTTARPLAGNQTDSRIEGEGDKYSTHGEMGVGYR